MGTKGMASRTAGAASSIYWMGRGTVEAVDGGARRGGGRKRGRVRKFEEAIMFNRRMSDIKF
jgi:hypothetical protein